MALPGKKCPREGTRVVAQVNPASAMLYSPGHGPTTGEMGTVVSVPLGGRRATCMPGPGGGLVYVKWDNNGTFGASRYDITKVSGKLGDLESQETFKKYKKCLRKCKVESPQAVIPCLDFCNGVVGVGGLGGGVRTSPDRFYSTQMVRGNLQTGQRIPTRRYTYESTNAIYDVDVAIDSNEVSFRKNNQPSEREPHHTAIIKHFNLVVPLGATFTQDKQPYGPDPSAPQWAVVDTRSGQTRYHWFTSKREAEAWNAKYNAGFVQSASELNMRPWEQPGFKGLGEVRYTFPSTE